MTAPNVPLCSKCRAVLAPEVYNTGTFTPCPACGNLTWVEAFASFGRKPGHGTAGELSVGGEDALCFYHESKKAAEVCEICGRFLCGLCDCVMSGKHYCPACLGSGASNRRIEGLDTERILYGRQALWLSLVPLYVTGIIAVYLSIRHRKAPPSLVQPRQWMMPAALVLGLLQTIGFTVLIIMASIR